MIKSSHHSIHFSIYYNIVYRYISTLLPPHANNTPMVTDNLHY